MRCHSSQSPLPDLTLAQKNPPHLVSTSVMIPELILAAVLLEACIDVLAVLYAVSKGYLGHPRRKGLTDSVAPVESHAAVREQPEGGLAAVATTVAESATLPVQAIYETVQPTPAPIHYVPSITSFGVPSIPKPTRTYRRRPAPVRSAAVSKASLQPKTKKATTEIR